MANKITTVCYGKEKVWRSVKAAKDFYTDAAINTEGSEQDRYVTILVGIELGYTHISDTGEYK